MLSLSLGHKWRKALNHWHTSVYLTCRFHCWHIYTTAKNDKTQSTSAWPFYLLSSLICHVSSFFSFFFNSTSFALQVMLWFTQVNLPFPFARKPYLVFTYGLSAEPLGVLTFFFLSTPALPQRPSHTCRHLCFCPALCLLNPPPSASPPALRSSAPHSLEGFSMRPVACGYVRAQCIVSWLFS